jgi:hypothetical protein
VKNLVGKCILSQNIKKNHDFFFPIKMEEINMIWVDFLIKGQYVPNILLFGKV